MNKRKKGKRGIKQYLGKSAKVSQKKRKILRRQRKRKKAEKKKTEPLMQEGESLRTARGRKEQCLKKGRIALELGRERITGLLESLRIEKKKTVPLPILPRKRTDVKKEDGRREGLFDETTR